MGQDIFESGLPKNPKYWYEAEYIGNHPKYGQQNHVMDVLHNSSTEAEILALDCCEPWQQLIGVHYRGTIDEYEAWQTENGGQAEWQESDEVVPGPRMQDIPFQ